MPPWVFASGGQGLVHCEIPLRKKEQSASSYSIRLIFGSKSWKNVAAVKLQGRPVEPALETKCLGGRMIEYRGVPVTERLVVDVESSEGTSVVLSGIEILEKGSKEIRQ